ncbi:hypothetical protein PybrP1_001270 [[Pythium] brassicae (nom. inval.)]|nr:hypothetical protein PybrP1_001270 [[Pythium] brassicae (nom. inval.)]
MKTAFVFASIAALFAQSAVAEKCVYSTVSVQLHSLAPEIQTCYDATGYYLAPPPAPPTAEQQNGICTKCQTFIAKVAPMVWPDCTLNLAGTEQTLTAFFGSVTSPCKATTSAPTTAPTTSPTTAPTTAPTKAPTPSVSSNSPPTTSPGTSPSVSPSTSPSVSPSSAPSPTSTRPASC